MHAGRSLDYLTPGALDELLSTAADVRRHPPLYRRALEGRVLACISLGTSFHIMMPTTVALTELGAHVQSLRRDDLGARWADSPESLGTLLSTSVDGVACIASQEWSDSLASTLTRPLLSACVGHHSPVDALALLYTIQRSRGSLSGLKLAVVGDGGAVSNGALLAGAVAGMTVAVAHPRGYAPHIADQVTARDHAARTGGAILVTEDVRAALESADVVVVDAWSARGGGRDPEDRREHFEGFTVTDDLLGLARPGVMVMHPGPIGVPNEVSTAVAKACASAMEDWARNRVHMAKALAVHTLGGSR